MTIEELYQIYLTYPLVGTDSRKIEANSIFFALQGDNFDGNQFADQAIKKGAAYAIIDDASYAKSDQYIVVENVLQTLQQLATYHRNQFKIPIIAVTGSNGKTTTKELMKAVLSISYPTHATQGNFNNHIGVPLTLLSMKKGTEVAIIEMGMNHLGEIAELCKIAHPTHGLITNIGKAHLEGVGNLEGVKQAKFELYQYLMEKKGLIFVNRDEQFLWDLVGAYRKRLSYSRSIEKAEHYIYQVDLLSSETFVKVQFKNDLGQLVQVDTKLIGEYNFNNIMTAIVIGQYFKVPPLKIKAAIENYVPSNNRSQIIQKGGNTFILDAYNANPTSMRNVLDYFHKYPAKNKIVILGDMFELGENSIQEHQELLDYIKNFNFKRVLLVGKLFSACSSSYLKFENIKDLKTWMEKQEFHNIHFLVKGSRGVRLEQVLD